MVRLPREAWRIPRFTGIRTDEAEEVMPPPESKLPLTEQEKDLLDRWIKEGGKYDTHWAFGLLPGPWKFPRPSTPSPAQ